MRSYQNILIVRTDRIGDVILTTPAIAALRQAYPNARLTIMVTPATREIVEDNPHLDEVIVYDQKGAHKGVRGFFKFINYLRQQKFDLAIVYHTKKRFNLICFLAGIPNRVGFKNNKFGFLLTHPIKDTRPLGDKHEYEYCLEVLKYLGVDAQVRDLFFPLHQDSEFWAEDFLRQNDLRARDSQKLIAVHPGASCISKRWLPERFAELIDKLFWHYDAKIILVGGPETISISESIKLKLKNPVLDVTGQTTVSQLASLLKRCHLLISNDSGPVHVAAAVNTPVISIFGRNQAGLSPTRWRPLGPKDIVLHREVGCEVCLAHNCQIDFKCLTAITPDDVMQAVDAIYQL